MKTKNIIALLTLATSVSALAQTGRVGPYGGIVFDQTEVRINLKDVCYRPGMGLNCDLSQYGIDLKLTGSKIDGDYPMSSTISTSLPIKKVSYSLVYRNDWADCRGRWQGGEWKGTTYSGLRCLNDDNGEASFDEDVFKISFKTKDGAYPTHIVLSNGIPGYLKIGLSGAGKHLRSSYAGVLRNVKDFNADIAKSHRGHLARFTQALEEGIKLLDTVDNNGKPAHSVLDWRVQENSRLIVVFGTVLNELLNEYDDVARLRNSIRSMRVLVEQLRESYGWKNSLAGEVSKASSSLIEVVRLELQELASIKMAMGAPGLENYTEMLKVTRNLQSKVNASKSGDMKAQREIFDFLDLWNGKEWQTEMERLMNAGPDFKNLVMPKLMMLILAIESISELTDQNFVVPDKATLAK